VTKIEGRADEGWGKVADAFQTNFDEHGELGAAVGLYVDGRPVVDLWGGIADKSSGRSWDEDTIVLVMSTSKGATAICANMLVERGQLDLDAPVVKYWPQFGAEGKSGIKVRWLLTHQAGLPVIDTPLTFEEACAWEPVIHALEQQAPLWEPGTAHAYHALTYGFLVGEVVRRITGKTLGQFLRHDVAEPLGLKAWIGLPAEQEKRVARLEAQPPPTDPAILEMMAQISGPDTVLGRSLTLGGAIPPGLVTEGGGLNSPMARAAEFPAANMVIDARSLARMYAATVGTVDGCRLMQSDTVARASTVQTADSVPFGLPPEMQGFAMQFGLGFMPQSMMMPGLGARSFGHPGAGGSLGFADPEAGVAFGYVMNQMAGGMGGDPRVAGLLDAIKSCLST
jgi:CubicO group peptidase (beta-lactamase class C family)